MSETQPFSKENTKPTEALTESRSSSTTQEIINELYYEFLLTEQEAKDLLNQTQFLSENHALDLTKHPTLAAALHIKESDKKIQELALMAELRQKTESQIQQLTLENWDLLLQDILYTVKKEGFSKESQPYIRGWIALFLEEVYSLYRKHNKQSTEMEERFHELTTLFDFDLSKFLSEFDSTFDKLGKRHPSFIESVEATFERHRVIEVLEKTLIPPVESIIVGGSMSYGPFFNTRKDLDKSGSSDIDAILVIPDGEFSFSVNSLDGGLFYPEEIESFVKRANYFTNLQQKGQADIFSHKCRVKNTDFDISMHIFPKSILTSMLNPDLTTQQSDSLRTLKDYKAKPFSHAKCVQTGFDGSSYTFVVPEQTKTEEGVIALLPSYALQSNRFYPGIYQNLISPRFSVFTDRTGETTELVKNFRTVMEAQLEKERQLFPNQPHSLLRSHIRFPIFSPHLSHRLVKK